MDKRCFEQAHMTCAEFGLWNQYRMLAYKSGVLFCDGRATAERFDGTSKSQIYRLRKSLVKKGWLEITKESKRSKDGTYSATTFKVLDHIHWVKKHGTVRCKKKLFEGLQPVPCVKMDGGSPVPIKQTTCPTDANAPVPSTGHNSKQNQIEINTGINLGVPPDEPLELVKTGTQNSLAKVIKPPVPEAQMVDPWPALSYAPSQDPYYKDKPWSAPKDREALPQEIAEIQRRNALRLRPEDVMVPAA